MALTSFAAAVMTVSVPADAAEPGIAVDPSNGPPLTTIKVTGVGYCGPPCTSVTIKIGNLYVTDGVPVAADGTFSTFARVPGSTRPGSVPVIAAQTDSNSGTVSSQTDFTVTVSQPPPVVYPPPSDTRPPSGAPLAPAQPTTDSSSSNDTASSASTNDSTGTVSASSRPALGVQTGADRPVDSKRSPIIIGLISAALTAAIGALWWRRRTPHP